MKNTVIILFILLAGCTGKEKKSPGNVWTPVKQADSEAKITSTQFTRKIKNTITQTCIHKDISFWFDYKITRHKDYYEEDSMSNKVGVYIIDKKSQRLCDSIFYNSELWIGNTFEDCTHSRSYITGKNKNAVVSDDDFGDIVIADLNFDGKEDIALVHNSGGADHGPDYTFYLQGDHCRFYHDPYLTDSMSLFPHKINQKNKTLTTLSVSGMCGVWKRIYQYQPESRQWKKITDTLRVICK